MQNKSTAWQFKQSACFIVLHYACLWSVSSLLTTHWIDCITSSPHSASNPPDGNSRYRPSEARNDLPSSSQTDGHVTPPPPPDSPPPCWSLQTQLKLNWILSCVAIGSVNHFSLIGGRSPKRETYFFPWWLPPSSAFIHLNTVLFFCLHNRRPLISS